MQAARGYCPTLILFPIHYDTVWHWTVCTPGHSLSWWAGGEIEENTDIGDIGAEQGKHKPWSMIGDSDKSIKL